MGVLGVTGSSGVGKSTISELFMQCKQTVIFDADKRAKAMDYPGSKYLGEIKKIAGDEILLETGNLNRKKLAEKLASDDSLREKVNEITKKYILSSMLEFINENSNKPLILLDIPILFENNLEKYCDKVLVVISDREEQIKRICARDNTTPDVAEKRLNMQHPNEYYTSRADFVINNTNKTKEDLKTEVEKIYEEMKNFEREKNEGLRF